jgi:predicted AAA+ superfamily ATPase
MRRARALNQLRELVRRNPVVTLLGPRQAGKTTLANEVAKGRRDVARFDLEDPNDLARLTNPRLALEEPRGLVIIDEVQRRPELFPILRVLVDRDPKRRFLILGSASGELLRQSSESLAGRVAFFELSGFSLDELPDVGKLWLRGGFPRSVLARSESASYAWRSDYVTTFLERDIPSFGLRIPSAAMRRFWMMLAHVHGQVINLSDLGRAFGATYQTMGHYLDILASTFMVRQLQPWFENISKRQVKAPKVYFRDSGLLHALLGLSTRTQLETHPRVGASWEGFALESVVHALRLRPGEFFFWSTHADAELDLLTFVGGKRYGFEFKRSDAPAVTRSMKVAIEDLKLEQLFVLYPGDAEFVLSERISAVGLNALHAPRAKFRRTIGLSS